MALGAGERPGGLYSAASPTLMPTAEITRGGDPTAAASPTPCLMRARPFSRAVPVLAHGLKWRPRHGHECGPCLARARRLPGRAVLGPGFSVSCLGRPSVPGPFGKVYTGGVPVAGAAKAWETARLERQRRGQ